jgi:hypothetical protein
VKKNLALVGQFNNLPDFDRAKALLDSAGLHPSSDNETSIQMRPHMAMAFGGVRLFVHADEAERARSILKTHQPMQVELNYAHRVKRSKLAGILGVSIGVLIGSIVGIMQSNLQTGFGVSLVASLVWFLILTEILVPKAKLK